MKLQSRSNVGGESRRYQWACGLIILLLIAVVGLTASPASVNLPKPVRALASTFHEFFPQGWGFFTKTPLDPNIIPFAEGPTGQMENVSRYSSAGKLKLSREYRVGEVDSGLVLGSLEEEVDWVDCRAKNPRQCAENNTQSSPIKVETGGWDLRLCGPLVLVKEYRIPFAYGRDTREKPMETLSLDIECDEWDE